MSKKIMKEFKSRIYIAEQIKNKQRKFGSINQYYPVIIFDENDKEQPALFTKNEIKIAVGRAQQNVEDVTTEKNKSFWGFLFG